MKKALDHRRYTAKAVHETIREQGRTVVWLAGKLGFSRQYTNDLVHGKFTVRHEVAQRVSDLLDVPLFLLFDVSGTLAFDATGVGEHAA